MAEESNEAKIEIQVGEETKVFTAPDVAKLLEGQEAGKAVQQKLSALLNTVERYGVTPEDYVTQAEGALELVGQLQAGGFFDAEGNFRVPEKGGQKEESLEDKYSAFFQKKDKSPIDRQREKMDMMSIEALSGLFDKKAEPLVRKIQELEQDRDVLLQENLTHKLLRDYKDLTPEDVPVVLRQAMRDKSRSLPKHIEDYLGGKTKSVAENEAAVLKKYGVDPVKLAERNKVRELAPGDIAGIVLGGRKVQLPGARVKDPNAITTKEAVANFFKLSRLAKEEA